MDVLGDLVARDRLDADSVLEVVGDPPRSYSYRRFATTAWKTGNFLRHLGVREGSTVAVTDDPAPEPLLTLFGAALLGAQVRFDPPAGPDCRVLVAPTPAVSRYDLPPGARHVGYGPRPTDPTVTHFGTDVWSENPAFPETDVVAPEDAVLVTDDGRYTHADLLAAAETVVDRHDLHAGQSVAVRASLAEPGAVVAGVVAPLLVGATILFGDGEPADLAVATGEVPESSVVDPTTLSL